MRVIIQELFGGPYQESGITVQSYKIYRKVGSGNFSLIHTNNETQFEYTDTDYYIPNSGGSQLQYYIKAYSVTGELSPPTNTVTTNGIITLKQKSGANSFVDENILHPNHPNPFNPSTVVINYSVKEAGLVKLRVYDILGSEIAELVYETQESGNHSVEFNASDIPSGVYIYTLQVNGYSDSKKMLLLK
jgi:Secretion system C-terminal sorting domain